MKSINRKTLAEMLLAEDITEAEAILLAVNILCNIAGRAGETSLESRDRLKEMFHIGDNMLIQHWDQFHRGKL